MEIKTLPFVVGIALSLAACGPSAPQPEDAPTASAVSQSSDNVNVTSSLARTQPDRPACDHCQIITAPNIPPDSNELSIAINAEYVGLVDDLEFVSYTSSSKTTYGFDQAVIDDLNDSTTVETVVMMNTPDIVRGLLIFTIGTETLYEPVRVIIE